MENLKNKIELLELIGAPGKLIVITSYEDENGRIITVYEKNGRTFSVRI